MIKMASASPAHKNFHNTPHNPSANALPGQSSMWLFVIGDLWIFTAYFACYIYDRGQAQDLFLAAQQQLSQGVGVVNTVILLTSSLFVVLATQAAKVSAFVTSARYIVYAAVCGVAFMVLKAVEWVPKIAAGITPGSNDFFMYYYMLTGLHLCHVILGLVILFLLWKELKFANKPRVDIVETGATYWHMVDLLWLTILALLYLMR